VPPSPNLRSSEAAIAYPGVCLLEATNVSPGRGTDTPFLLLGAPWLRPEDIRVAVPGFELEPAHFTPAASPAAPDPKYLGQECRGVRVSVTDAASAHSYRLGVELLAALRTRPEFEWTGDGAALTRLVGTPRLLDDLGSGRSIEQIVAADEPAHDAWRTERAPALLY
jgi:uncharacterized protein YbbC (DUF1343 family)